MARRFASSTEQEIEKLLKQKDSENKRRLTKIAKELFHEYLRKKAFRSRKTRRTQMLKLLAVLLFTCKTMYNKTIIRFGFCDIRNNQGLGKCYQPQPPTSADDSYLDLDYSGYRKNLIQ